jgi:hypothetical protein
MTDFNAYRRRRDGPEGSAARTNPRYYLNKNANEGI